LANFRAAPLRRLSQRPRLRLAPCASVVNEFSGTNSHTPGTVKLRASPGRAGELPDVPKFGGCLRLSEKSPPPSFANGGKACLRQAKRLSACEHLSAPSEARQAGGTCRVRWLT
jgi:hypothetical protein